MTFPRFARLTAAGLLLGSLFAAGCSRQTTAPPSATAPSPSPSAVAMTGDAAAGQKVFMTTCIACHGADARGLKGLGKNLVTSKFAKGQTDAQLVEFIEKGRDTSDPMNTTHVAMPPKGGNPALTDQDLYNVVAYVRTLQKR